MDYQIPEGIEVSALHESAHRMSTNWFAKRWMARKLARRYREMTTERPFDLTISTLPLADHVVSLAGLPRVWFRLANTLSAEVDTLTRRSGRKSRRRLARYQSIYGGQRLIAVSAGVAQDVVGKMQIQPLKMATIYNAFDQTRMREQAAVIDPDIPSEPYILHVGRFQPQKRHDLLLDAYKESSLPQRLVLLAKPHAVLIDLIASRGLQSRVVVAGFRQNPFPWYARADAVVLSSDREGLPNVLVESLICGTPVVSTDCPSGPSEVLRGEMRRWLVPCNNVAELAAKMREVVEHRPAIDPSLLLPFSKRATLDALEAIAKY
jgi:glycosyltransferase involved in cell wall biosynthesis